MCRGPRRWAGGCVVAVIPSAVQGHANIWERQEGSSRRAGGIQVARHQSTLRHIRQACLKRPVFVAPDTWEMETPQCRPRSAKGASCTSSDGAASSETGGRGGRIDGVQEGWAPQGRTQSASGAIKQKKSCYGRGLWHLTQGRPAMDAQLYCGVCDIDSHSDQSSCASIWTSSLGVCLFTSHQTMNRRV
jgi:hypothetical protein